MKFKFISLIVVFLIHCSKGETTFVETNVSGVKTIHNLKPKWGDLQNTTLKLVNKIGGVQELDENKTFYFPLDVSLDNKGNKYILDAGNQRIQKYSNDWNYIKSIGQKGQGPGEFLRPKTIFIDENDNIYVGDNSQKSIIKLNNNGIEIKRFRLNSKFNGRFSFAGELLITGGGTITLLGSQEIQDNYFLVAYDHNGEKKYQFIKPYISYFGSGMKVVDTACTFVIDSDNNIYIAFDYHNIVEKYDQSGTKLLSISREIEFEEKKSAFNFDEDTGRVSAERMPNLLNSGIAFDNSNRIWVVSTNKYFETYKKVEDVSFSDDFEILVYNDEGILLTKIPIDHYANEIRIFDDMLYIIDSNYSMAVYEYQIIAN